MDRALPAELEAPTEDMDDIEARDKNICWKTKGVAFQTTYRLFSKYGNPKHCDDKYKTFSEGFLRTYALPLLESHLQQLLKRQSHFVGSKSLNFSIKYVSQSTKLPKTMEVMKPYIEKLLYEVIVSPIMLLTHRDVTIFKDDPVEYIRKQNDFSETLFAPKNTAVDLLGYLCKHKSAKKAKQPDYLGQFLAFCARNLEQGIDWRLRESLLYAVGSLIEEIQPYKTLRVLVDPMLSSHVLPVLQNQQPFLRMRGLWLYSKYVEDMQFKNEEHLAKVVELSYACLINDSQLPVRLQAALTISKLLQKEKAAEVLKPHLAQILQAFLKLMSEIESEELVNALEEVVTMYRDDIGPFAIQLT